MKKDKEKENRKRKEQMEKERGLRPEVLPVAIRNLLQPPAPLLPEPLVSHPWH
jgi:hypothetical protein